MTRQISRIIPYLEMDNRREYQEESLEEEEELHEIELYEVGEQEVGLVI